MNKNILIRDLPEWLIKDIKKKLMKRMSRPDAERLMNGTLAELTPIFEKNT